MKLGPVTRLDKNNTATSKNFNEYVMSANCDVIAIFPIYCKFKVIWKPDSGCMVCKTYVVFNNKFYLTKTESRTEKSLTELLYYCFE